MIRAKFQWSVYLQLQSKVFLDSSLFQKHTVGADKLQERACPVGRGKEFCVSGPHNDNHRLPRRLELINVFHPGVTQLVIKYALEPIRLLEGRNVQLLKASLSMQVPWRHKFDELIFARG